MSVQRVLWEAIAGERLVKIVHKSTFSGLWSQGMEVPNKT